MPALSSTMEEGTIVQWLKEVGDKIEVGSVILVRSSCACCGVTMTLGESVFCP